MASAPDRFPRICAKSCSTYAHSAAPGAKIVAYIGNDAASPTRNGLFDAIVEAVNDNTCGIISISFHFCGEAPSFYTGTMFSLFAQAAAQGQAVFASSGDEGAAGQVFSVKRKECVTARRRNINELSANPYITSVGGTQFDPAYDSQSIATGYATESVWDHPVDKGTRGASGGRRSAIYPKPAFQSGVFPHDTRRNIPDVAFGASRFNPGYFVGEQGQIQCCTGGTSLGTPYWAGIAALTEQEAGGQRIGNINRRIYSLGPLGSTSLSGLHDITIGRNSLHGVFGYPAKPGYDRASGWGTPDIGIIVPLLAK